MVATDLEVKFPISLQKDHPDPEHGQSHDVRLPFARRGGISSAALEAAFPLTFSLVIVVRVKFNLAKKLEDFSLLPLSHVFD